MHLTPELCSSAVLAAAGSWLAYMYAVSWVHSRTKPPETFFQPEGDADRIYRNCPKLQQPFKPSPWAFNPHLQSVLGYLRTATKQASYTRQLLISDDGGSIALDWFNGSDIASSLPEDAPILLVIHGINGGSHEGCCKWACDSAVKQGWRAVVMNMRGCGGLSLTSPRGYNALMSYDVHVAIASIQGRFPSAPVFAVAYSLGTLLLSKYLAELNAGAHGGYRNLASEAQLRGRRALKAMAQGGVGASSARQVLVDQDFHGSSTPSPRTPGGLQGVVMISSPGCISSTNKKMSDPWKVDFLYNLALAYKLRDYVRVHREEIESGLGWRMDLDSMLSTWTVRGIDHTAVTQGLGYTDPEDYYLECSTANYLPHVGVPTLFLVSRDDPFLGLLPLQQCTSNPNILLAVTERGGHVAFLQGWWPLGESWMDQVMMEFLQGARKVHQEKLEGRWSSPEFLLPYKHVGMSAPEEVEDLTLNLGEAALLVDDGPDEAALMAEFLKFDSLALRRNPHLKGQAPVEEESSTFDEPAAVCLPRSRL